VEQRNTCLPHPRGPCSLCLSRYEIGPDPTQIARQQRPIRHKGWSIDGYHRLPLSSSYAFPLLFPFASHAWVPPDLGRAPPCPAAAPRPRPRPRVTCPRPPGPQPRPSRRSIIKPKAHLTILVFIPDTCSLKAPQLKAPSRTNRSNMSQQSAPSPNPRPYITQHSPPSPAPASAAAPSSSSSLPARWYKLASAPLWPLRARASVCFSSTQLQANMPPVPAK
jgi:hypothetical protein